MSTHSHLTEKKVSVSYHKDTGCIFIHLKTADQDVRQAHFESKLGASSQRREITKDQAACCISLVSQRLEAGNYGHKWPVGSGILFADAMIEEAKAYTEIRFSSIAQDPSDPS